MNHPKKMLLQQLPSIDKLLQEAFIIRYIEKYGRPLITNILRSILAQYRNNILQGSNFSFSYEMLSNNIKTQLYVAKPTLHPIINATGVILHTNLGRAPLSQQAIQAIQDICQNYSNLEYDLDAGKRGSRAVHAEKLLDQITGAESAFITNNNAASVLLMLSALCKGKDVIISRGELIEIGGGFRILDVMKQSGCNLVEVGTTNRTHLKDYEQAITSNTAGILVAHHSNYQVVGFTHKPTLPELAKLAHHYNLPLLYDQGSGTLIDPLLYGLNSELTIPEALATGVDLIAFSGDKLLGGPQAGILAGKKALVDLCQVHPLARAVRPDKLCLAALSATLISYITGQAHQQIPVWQMISKPLTEIERLAYKWAHSSQACVIDGFSTIGGGSLPGTTLPTKLVALSHSKPDILSEKLRHHKPSIVTRIQHQLLLIDPRTVLPHQEKDLQQALNQHYSNSNL